MLILSNAEKPPPEGSVSCLLKNRTAEILMRILTASYKADCAV
jgi:hypothetical protein